MWEMFLHVTDGHQGLQCDTCNIWFHAPCQRVGNMVYDYLSNSNCSWHSTKCDSINYSLGSVSDLNSFASVNSFNALHSPDKGFQPASSSTPIKRQSPKTTPSPTPALKVFHINFQSLREKSSSLVLWNWINQTLLLALKLGLPKRCLTVSFSHQSLDSVYRRNHIGQKGGGVIILVRSALSSEERLNSTQPVKTSGSS